MRIHDPAALQRARDRGYCERCGKICTPHPHHIRSRGAGGGDTDDNLVSLCLHCHTWTHQGLVSRAELRDLIASRPHAPTPNQTS